MPYDFSLIKLFKDRSTPGSSVGTSSPSDTLGREFDPGKRDFSH